MSDFLHRENNGEHEWTTWKGQGRICYYCFEEEPRQEPRQERPFTPRHGLRYRWWRDIPWDIIVTTIVIVLLLGMLALVLGAWVFDWKGWW